MSYDGVSGLYTVFPTAGARPSSGPSARASSPSGGRACKYGPRLSNGRCPPKPASEKPPCKYGPRLANGRCPLKPRTEKAQAAGLVRGVVSSVTGARRGSAGDRIAGAVGGSLGVAALRRVKSATLQKAGGAGAQEVLSRVGPRAALALRFGGVAAAGLLAYYITKRIIENRAIARETRAEQAFRISQAYREARVEAERLNKGPLTPRQQADFRDIFKAQLAALGLETDNLKGL